MGIENGQLKKINQGEAGYLTQDELDTLDTPSIKMPEEKTEVAPVERPETVSIPSADAPAIEAVRARLEQHREQAPAKTPESVPAVKIERGPNFSDPNVKERFKELMKKTDAWGSLDTHGQTEPEQMFRRTLALRMFSERANRNTAAGITGAVAAGTAIGVPIMIGSAFAALPIVAMGAAATGAVWGGMKLYHSLRERSLLKKGEKFFGKKIARPTNY